MPREKNVKRHALRLRLSHPWASLTTLSWKLTYYSSKESFYGFCDLVARDESVPYLISIYGPVSVVQGMVAALQTGRYVHLSNPAYDDEPYYIRERKKVMLHCKHQFKGFFTKTPSNLGHAILVAKQAFERGEDGETILFDWGGNILESFWRVLSKDYSCPVDKEWLPYLWSVAQDKGYVQDIDVEDLTEQQTHKLAMSKMIMTEDELRQMVSRGLKTGQISIKGRSADNHDITNSKLAQIKTLEDYLLTYRQELDSLVHQATVPLHDPDKDPWHEGLNDLLRKPFRMQGHVVTALNKLLAQQNHAFLVAEQGAGKSLMGAALGYLLTQLKSKGRFLIMCPPHLVRKWKEEIEKTVPNALATIIYHYSELCKIHRESPRKPAGLEFYIISRETAKLGYFTKPAARWNDRLGGWVCPDCGRLLYDEINEEIEPWSGKVFAKRTNKNSCCPHCKEEAKEINAEKFPNRPKSVTNRGLLWEPNVKLYGKDLFLDKQLVAPGGLFDTEEEPEPTEQARRDNTKPMVRRFAPAEYAKRKMKNWFDLLLIDEVHEMKGDSTAQGNALGMLARAAKKKVALTGTLFGGKSSNIFYLLWRIAPQVMKKAGYEYKDLPRWVDHYGISETLTKFKDEIEFNKASRGQAKGRTIKKELPGISPCLYSNFLMRNCIFLSLSEIEDLELPDYSEQVIQVDMGDPLRGAYRDFMDTLYNEVKAALVKGDQSLLGSYLISGLAYPDAPFNSPDVYHPGSGRLVAAPEKLPESIVYPKEQALLDLIKQEVAQNRKVFVYMHFTGTRDMQPRIEVLLNKAGIKTAILRSSVAPEKRMDWVIDKCQKGVQVIIGNPSLVATGLDLYNHPTLVFYQCGYSLYTLRQAARRSLRPFQTQDVRVYFMGYEDTLQADALSLMGEKLEASMSIEGKWSEEGLRAMGKAVQDVRVALAKRLYEEEARKLESAVAKWGRMFKSDGNVIVLPTDISLIGGEQPGELTQVSLFDITEVTASSEEPKAPAIKIITTQHIKKRGKVEVQQLAFDWQMVS